MHHPPLVIGVPAWDEIGLASADRHALGDVIERHPQVRRVVSGHFHSTITGELAGRGVLVVPSTYVQTRLDFNVRELELTAELRGLRHSRGRRRRAGLARQSGALALGALDDHLQAVIRAGVPGAVVAAGPDLSWERAAGVADAESGTPMTTEHRFLIGSVSKTFVAAVVLQLVGEGALALDEEVGPIAEGVTLRQLLNHTSGLPDYYADFDSLIEPYRADRGYKPNAHAPRRARARARQAASLSTRSRLGVLGRQLPRARADRRGGDGRDPARGAEATDRRAAGPRWQPICETGTPVSHAPISSRAIQSSPDAGPGLDDVTDVELFGWGAGEMVSTGSRRRTLPASAARGRAPRTRRASRAADHRPLRLGGERRRTGWESRRSRRSWDRQTSPCGSAWGHLGFAMGHTTIALSSESGDRQVVVCANSLVMSDETWQALGRLVWAGYCR